MISEVCPYIKISWYLESQALKSDQVTQELEISHVYESKNLSFKALI